MPPPPVNSIPPTQPPVELPTEPPAEQPPAEPEPEPEPPATTEENPSEEKEEKGATEIGQEIGSNIAKFMAKFKLIKEKQALLSPPQPEPQMTSYPPSYPYSADMYPGVIMGAQNSLPLPGTTAYQSYATFENPSPKKKKRMSHAIISKKPSQPTEVRTIYISNIDKYPSVLEVESFLKETLEQMSVDTSQIESLQVPQSDYYGTPVNPGYAFIVMKKRQHAHKIIEIFNGRLFGNKTLRAAIYGHGGKMSIGVEPS